MGEELSPKHQARKLQRNFKLQTLRVVALFVNVATRTDVGDDNGVGGSVVKVNHTKIPVPKPEKARPRALQRMIRLTAVGR